MTFIAEMPRAGSTQDTSATFDDSYWLTVRSTIRLPLGDAPDPDLALRPGPGSRDNANHPLPLLVVEISDETLLFDQTMKSSMYAANGVADYWIINCKQNVVEVYRNPIADPTRKRGYRYADVKVFAAGPKISPLCKPQVSLEVDRMLP